MCDPATLTLVAAGVSMAGTGFSALQSAAQSRFQGRVADQNAKLANESAQQEQSNTRSAALEHYRKTAELKGQQRAAMAANGIDVDFGSAADVQGDTDMLANEDVRRIYGKGEQAARGFEIEASNFGGQANAARSAATGALVKGAFDMGSTALSTAKQYGKLSGKVASSSNFG